jgi:hypothetical protein
MGLNERTALVKRIQDLRGSSVICFLTSVRQNVPGIIADDSVRVFFDHLLLLPVRPVEKLDIFLCSNGGSGTVPWRLVSLFREFAKSFNVLIPYRAYSAASLIALGADEIVMHPFAELGPIDPTVSNEFNPTDDKTGARIGISVEDVTAYVNFIKSTVGITHEDELVRAIEILAQKVHPLAIGNIERFISQSRMIARKILRTHMGVADQHTIDEIVENMASKLYFHGHPINRREAREDLKLKVMENPPPELETAIWDLYKDYEGEFNNLDAFNPASDLYTIPDPGPQGQPREREYELLHAMVDSERLTSRFTTRRRYRLVQQYVQMPGQPMQVAASAVQEELLQQGWSHSPVPAAGSSSQPSTTSVGGAPSP